jgi:glycosyltransferase involved in cell wall biosynthesis
VAPLRFRRRSDALLALVDVASVALSCWAAFALRFEGDPPIPAHFRHLYWVTSACVCLGFVPVARVTGLYRRSALRHRSGNVEAAFEACLTVAAVLFVVDVAALSGDLSRAWIALTAFFLLLSSVGMRALVARGRRALVPFGIALERYAVVGPPADARRLHADLTRAAGAPFQIVAVHAGDAEPETLAAIAARERLDGFILTAGSEPARVGELATRLAGHAVDVFVAPRFGDLDYRVASIATFHGVPLLRMAGLAPRRRAIRRPADGTAGHGVAILGTRGIPANYGGFETFAERLALQLVDRGLAVTVYCRRHHATQQREWRGVRLVTLPTIKNKYLDTVVHTALSVAHLVTRTRIRSVVLCNAANAPVLPLLRLTGRRVLMNVDGLEWRRGKWGIAGRAWYRMGEWLSVRASSVLITDAEEVRTYYRVRHDTDSVMIPYGADGLPRHLPLPADLAVRPDAYALYVSRWEPENNPLLVARAHAAAQADLGLVMLGRATYDADLEREVRSAAAGGAVLPGALFGEPYRALQANARCYIHATEVGGTHPALIEAMGAGNLCLVLDTPENREVAGPDAWFFGDGDELAALLRKVADLDNGALDALRERSRARAAELFSWTAVGDAYLALIRPDK